MSKARLRTTFNGRSLVNAKRSHARVPTEKRQIQRGIWNPFYDTTRKESESASSKSFFARRRATIAAAHHGVKRTYLVLLFSLTPSQSFHHLCNEARCCNGFLSLLVQGFVDQNEQGKRSPRCFGDDLFDSEWSFLTRRSLVIVSLLSVS